MVNDAVDGLRRVSQVTAFQLCTQTRSYVTLDTSHQYTTCTSAIQNDRPVCFRLRANRTFSGCNERLTRAPVVSASTFPILKIGQASLINKRHHLEKRRQSPSCKNTPVRPLALMHRSESSTKSRDAENERFERLVFLDRWGGDTVLWWCGRYGAISVRVFVDNQLMEKSAWTCNTEEMNDKTYNYIFNPKSICLMKLRSAKLYYQMD